MDATGTALTTTAITQCKASTNNQLASQGEFSGYSTCTQNNTSVTIPETHLSTPNKPSPPLSARTASREGSDCFAPADFKQRIDYINRHRVPNDQAVINNPEVQSVISRLSKENLPSKQRKQLLKKLFRKVQTKHNSDYLKAISTLDQHKHLFPFSPTGYLQEQIKKLTNSQEMLDQETIIKQLGMVDAAYTAIIDIASLLNCQLLTETITPCRYADLFNNRSPKLTFSESPENEYTDETGSLWQQFAKRTTHTIDREVFDHSLFPLVTKIKEQGCGIYCAISKASAESLKMYLEAVGVNRLFLPMAGSGYFGAQMKETGIPVSCFDIAPPNRTFTRVVESEASDSTKTFSGLLQKTGQSISKSAMVIDAPSPTFYSDEGKMREPANFFLCRLMRHWATEGGNKVVVLSEAAIEAELFSPDVMKMMRITIEPVEPGFSKDIYSGLGDFVGVCGVYTVKLLANND